MKTLLLMLPLLFGCFSFTYGEKQEESVKNIPQNSLNTSSDNFHLSFDINRQYTNPSLTYGVLLHSQQQDGKLEGDLFKPYFSNGLWYLSYGTYYDGVYSEAYNICCDFGGDFNGHYDLYAYDSTLAYRMGNWTIGTLEMIHHTGETKVINNSADFEVFNLEQNELQAGIGNYIYRNQWGGYNHWGYTACYNQGQSHSFTMTIPETVNTDDIEKLLLIRFAPNRTSGQLAGVKINGIEQADFLNSSTGSSHGDQIYEINKSVLSTKTLNFEITAKEAEYCVAHYRLAYQQNGKLYLADTISIGSEYSQTKHNYISNGIGWNGSQYLFVDLRGAGLTTLIGNRPGCELKTMTALDTINSSKVEQDLINGIANVDFAEYTTIGTSTSYEVKLSLSSRDLGKYSQDSSIYQFTYPCAGKWTLDIIYNDLDQSNGGPTLERTVENTYTIDGYVEPDYDFVTYKVETDAYGIEKDGFVRLFNPQASHKYELGSYNKDSKISFDFEGAAISLMGYKGPLGGNFKVTFDGMDKGTYSTYADKEQYQTTNYVLTQMNAGKHNITIETLEDKWFAFDFFEIDIEDSKYYAQCNLAQIGNIITSSPNPTGGGNKDLNVIRNEVYYPEGTSGVGPAQYDSFVAPGNPNTFHMGYTFENEIEISKLVYQMGCTWETGGWFKDGSLHIEGLINNNWTKLDLVNDPGYPNSDKRSDFIENKVYNFIINPTKLKGIRIIGEAGGAEHFVSVAQIEVYQNKDIKAFCEGKSYRENIFAE